VIIKTVAGSAKSIRKGRCFMKRNVNSLKLFLGQLDRRHIRLGLGVLTLALFVLGAGAPGAHTG
jgi:hypothetical protein